MQEAHNDAEMRSSRLHHPTLLWLACLLLLLPTGRSSTAVKRGLCEKHGAHGVCIAAGCNEGAAERSKEKKVCIWHSCSNPAALKGPCTRHGGRAKRVQSKRMRHSFRQTWSLLQARRAWNVSFRWLHRQRSSWVPASHRSRRREEEPSRAAPLPLQARASVPNTVVVTVSARWMAAPLLHRNVVSVPSTVRTEHASPMAALPTLCIASLTAAGGRIKPCPDHPGCIVPSRSKGICFKHVGGYGGCWIVGCTSKMVGRLMVCSKHGGKGHSQSLSSLVFLQIPRVP